MAVGTNIPTTISTATDAENYLDAAIIASWRRHKEGEPDISTERLMDMVRDDTGAESTGRLKHCGPRVC
jgi:hypothetical protein